MRTILISGFEAFGGEKNNPSLQAVTILNGWSVADVNVVAVYLPVGWEKVASIITNILDTYQPLAFIAVGQAGGRAKMAVERIGINTCLGKDNYEILRRGEKVVESGADGYFASIDPFNLSEAMNAAGAPAYVSNTAGTYLCNYALYTIEHHIRQHHLETKSTFIHIPFLPEQITEKKEATLPSMSLDTIILGLKAAIRYVVEGKESTEMDQGEIH
ncbi:MAG: pyroglutamyl-peptidase I [bacterium]|nr:pyroglutamyl-peptidase I [bacterium]